MSKIHITKNKMFPLEVSNVENLVLITCENDESKVRHMYYGHLNIKGLRLLNEKVMVL